VNYDFNPLSSPIESKSKWDLLMWPYENNWGFNLYKYLIINEQFLKGTEKCIDKWYMEKTGKDYKTHKSYLWGHFSKEKTDQWDTTWEFIKDDPEDPLGGFYKDTTTGQTLWLCPLWTMMWGEKPDTLYITWKPDDDPN
jgi:hypothetical protein